MAVTLSKLPLPWQAKLSLIDFGIDQAGAAGGARQRDVRVGSRWAATFAASAGLQPTDARKLIAARLAARAAGSTVIAPFPQPQGAPALGSPVVAGGGQAGGVLTVRGLTAGVTVGAGLWFSFSVGARSFLYMTVAAPTADGSGNATLPIAPWLRAPPADGAALDFLAPKIEGFIQAMAEDWTLDMLVAFGVPSFTIQELQ
jgi:hypothetical protein